MPIASPEVEPGVCRVLTRKPLLGSAPEQHVGREGLIVQLPDRSPPRCNHRRTAHQTLTSAHEFYADIKRQAGAFGRSPDEIRILPGISPFIGSTQAEADRLQEEFNDLIQPEYSLTQLRQMIGLDLSGFDLTALFRGISSTPAADVV